VTNFTKLLIFNGIPRLATMWSSFCSKPNKMHQCIKFILFWNDTLHVSDGLFVHHQEFRIVHTATGIVRQILLWYYYRNNITKHGPCSRLIILSVLHTFSHETCFNPLQPTSWYRWCVSPSFYPYWNLCVLHYSRNK
jgi:hypothetical protein